jgi:hypothetical protein
MTRFISFPMKQDFDLTEDEFRSVFRAIAEARPDVVLMATPMLIAQTLSSPSVIEALESKLGAERFAHFQRARDPAHALLREIGRLKRLSREQIDRAYTVLSDDWAARSGADRSDVPEELKSLLGRIDAATVYRLFHRYRSQPEFSRQAPQQLDAVLKGMPFRVLPGAERQ